MQLVLQLRANVEYKPAARAWAVKHFVHWLVYRARDCSIPILDNDGKYSQPFLDALKSSGIKTKRTAIRSPNTVAFVERVIQTIQQEVLDHCIVFGRAHMDILCSQFKDQYHLERLHQDLDYELIQKPPTKRRSRSIEKPDTLRLSDIRCYERIGALLKSYSRKAA